VRAPEDDGVCAGIAERTDEDIDEFTGFCRFEFAGLDLLDETGSRLGDDADLSAEFVEEGGEAGAAEHSDRGEDADDSISGCGGGGLHGGLHSDDRDVWEFVAQVCGGAGGGGVARDDERLAAALEEEFRERAAAFDDEFGRLVSVGNVSGIRDVDQVLVRKNVADFPEDRESADAGVEYTDGTRGSG
jgi:hypothetical protein